MPGHHICVWAQAYTFMQIHDCDHMIITCQGPGHKCVWAQTCLGTNVSGHKRVWAQARLGTNMCGHKRVWAQTFLDTSASGHKRVWAQSCGLKYMYGHKRLGSSMYGHKRVVSVIEWPSRSPDLNPIENLWGIMVTEWTDRNERTPYVLELRITRKCGRSSAEILSYANSWCSQCD